MTTALTIADVERVLGRVGVSIDASSADLAPAVLGRLETGPPAGPARAPRRDRRVARPSWLIAAVVGVAVAMIITIPAPRRAVARWFGIGSGRLALDSTLPTAVPATFPAPVSLPTTVGDGGPMVGGSGPLVVGTGIGPDPVAAAESATGVVMPVSEVLGPPLQVRATEPPGPAMIVATWPVTEAAPETGTPGVGARLWVVRGSVERALFAKFAAGGSPASVEQVVVGPAAGVFISGPEHVVVMIGADGAVIADTAQLAGNTVLWASEGVTYRLETALGRDEAVALASSFVAG